MEQETIFQSLWCRITRVYHLIDQEKHVFFRWPCDFWWRTKHEKKGLKLSACMLSHRRETLTRWRDISDNWTPPPPPISSFSHTFSSHHPPPRPRRVSHNNVSRDIPSERAALRQRAVDFVSWYFCCAINSPNWWSCQRRAQVATAWPRQHFGLQTVAGVTASIKSPRELSNIVSTRVLSLIAKSRSPIDYDKTITPLLRSFIFFVSIFFFFFVNRAIVNTRMDLCIRFFIIESIEFYRDRVYRMITHPWWTLFVHIVLFTIFFYFSISACLSLYRYNSPPPPRVSTSINYLALYASTDLMITILLSRN